MRAILVPALTLGLSVSAAAFAQSQASGAQQSGSQSSQLTSTRSYKEVEDALKQAGIQNVRTLNAAYLVSAVTKNGEQVTFVVDPPIPGAAAASGNSGQQSASSGQQAGSSGQPMTIRGQQQVRDSLTKAGFTNVQFLDAAYLAVGKTENGDMITMMIDPSAKTGATGASASGAQPNAGQSGSTTKP